VAQVAGTYITAGQLKAASPQPQRQPDRPLVRDWHLSAVWTPHTRNSLRSFRSSEHRPRA